MQWAKVKTNIRVFNGTTLYCINIWCSQHRCCQYTRWSLQFCFEKAWGYKRMPLFMDYAAASISIPAPEAFWHIYRCRRPHCLFAHSAQLVFVFHVVKLIAILSFLLLYLAPCFNIGGVPGFACFAASFVQNRRQLGSLLAIATEAYRLSRLHRNSDPTLVHKGVGLILPFLISWISKAQEAVIHMTHLHIGKNVEVLYWPVVHFQINIAIILLAVQDCIDNL